MGREDDDCSLYVGAIDGLHSPPSSVVILAGVGCEDDDCSLFVGRGVGSQIWMKSSDLLGVGLLERRSGSIHVGVGGMVRRSGSMYFGVGMPLLSSAREGVLKRSMGLSHSVVAREVGVRSMLMSSSMAAVTATTAQAHEK